MSYDYLENKGLIEKVSISKMELGDMVDISNRDISTSEYVIAHDVDWALTIAYNSVHQILLAIMYKEGYRPKGEAKHKVVIDFCRIALAAKYKSNIDIIDRMRKKRNKAVYRHIKTVSELEAKEGIRFAKEFVARITEERLKL